MSDSDNFYDYDESAVSGNTRDGVNKTVKSTENNERVQELKKYGIAIIIALFVYFIAFALFRDSVSYFWRSFLSLLVGIVSLAALNTIQKTPPVIGLAVVMMMIVIFIVSVTNHHAQEKERKNGLSLDKTKPMSSAPNLDDVLLILSPGEHEFAMEPGDSTKWLTIPPAGLYRYDIYSKNYGHTIRLFGENNERKDSPDLVLPYYEKPVFKVRALVKETVFIKITKI